MASAADFLVNGESCPPEASVSFSSVVNLVLVSVSFNTAAWTIEGTSGEDVEKPVITLGGSPLGATASFTMPADPSDGRGVSFIVKCLIDNGRNAAGQVDQDLVKTALVGAQNANGIVPFAVGERFERSQSHGWTEALNGAIAVEGGGGGGGGFTVAGSPAIGKYVGYDGTHAVWTVVGGLTITSFGPVASLVECGQTVSDPAFGAAMNTTPATLVLTNNANGESKSVVSTPTSFTSSQSYQKTTPNQSVTFTLTGTLPGSANAVRTSSITWGQKNYWGVSSSPANTEAFIEGLSSGQLNTARNTGFTVNATGTTKIYFACPTRYGTPTFTVGGFVGGFVLRATGISVTNAQGYTETYDLYESVNAGLGSTAVTVS